MAPAARALQGGGGRNGRLLLSALLVLGSLLPLSGAEAMPNSSPRLEVVTLWTAGGLLAILAAVVVWNRSLALKVRSRTSALSEQLARRIQADQALAASEEKFSKAFRSSPDAIFLTRLSDGGVIDTNDSGARIFASAKEELIGHRSLGEGWGHVCVEDRDRFIARVRDQGGTLRDHELQMLRKNGERFTALVSCETIEVGGEKCLVGVLRDVTAERRAQEALQTSESALSALMDALPTPAMLLEKDGTFAAANEALARRLQRRRQELIGQNVYALLPPDLASSRRAAINRVFSSGQGIRFEDSNGGRHYINYLSPAPDASGAVTRVAAFALDITERQQTEQALQSVLAATATQLGRDFFRSLVEHLARALAVKYAFVGELVAPENTRVQVTSVWAGNGFGDPFEYDLEDTPCAQVAGKRLCLYPHSVQSRFPKDVLLQQMGVESYLGVPLFDKEGRALGLLVVLHDQPLADSEINRSILTVFAARAGAELERLRAEQALRASEERLRLALEAAHMGIFDWDMTSQRIVWSHWHEELWGFKPGEFAGTYEAFSQRVHPDDLPGVNAEVTRCMAAGEPFIREFRVVWPDGGTHWILGTGRFEFAPDGQPRRMLGTVIEISDRKRAETERQQLLVQLLEAEDEERGRLARELHDTTAQHLVATKMNLTRLSESGAALTPPGPQLVADSLGLLDRALHEIRTFTYLLHPPLLEALGLAGAVRDYSSGFAERSGVRTTVDAEGFTGRLPPAMELALFRVVQESLGNVHRHSGSDCARIRLERDAQEVRLEIQDNGRGMPADARAGVGLAGMRERLRQLGGRLEVGSDAEGTTVLASLPLGKMETGRSAGPTVVSGPAA
jgi:PAS domain S-box-containing protein